ncbi:MAG: hypothetical protein IKT91_05460 [Clostridia bacterium]|nr:hypothetical protein [Clostridia bacterium]
MAYCRNCRAQLKTAQVCPVCGTQRIPAQKGLLRRKQIPLPDVKNGAEALRAGLREGSTLLLLIAGVSLLGSAVSLAENLHLIPQGNIMAIISAVSAVISLLLPAGMLLLWREKDNKGTASPRGIYMIMGHQLWGMVYSAALLLYAFGRPIGNDGESVAKTIWYLLTSDFGSMIIPGILILLFALLVLGAVFGVAILWEWYGFRLCRKALLLARENKRFRISRLYEAGFLIIGAFSFIMAFAGDKSLLQGLSSCAGGASMLLQYTLLIKIKKHI